MSNQIKSEWYEAGLSFGCTQCGNCCTGPPGYVWFNEDELQDMADHLHVSTGQFLKSYAHRIHGRWSLNEQWNKQVKGYDCVFLRRDDEGKALCSIYSVRPHQCRTWPFWPENLKSEQAWQRAATNCPGMNKGVADQGRFYPVQQIRIIRGSHTSP